MKSERWQEINDLFQSAAERAPEERAAFLDEACHADETLRREVRSLIASYERAGNFIETPAFEVAPELLSNDDRAGALVGESIGHYRIESLIGVGGMGEVYLARDELLGRKVALKFLPESLTANQAQLNRLEHEARTASALNHPNILTVHEIGVDGRRHFIATEFIEGETLRAVLARGKLDLRDALDIAIQVGSALAAAHKSGVLHRDIKPENIMLRPDRYVKVLDFGIAKLTEQRPAPDNHDVRTMAMLETRPGLVIGTARYMSPEQARGQPVDARTDIWSLGVFLYEMITGAPPFEGETTSDGIAAMLTKEPSWLALEARQVPTRLEQIIQKALRKDKEKRYQSVEEMLADLRRLKEVSESITSGWKQQKKITAFLAASVALALIVAGLFVYLRPTRTVTNNLAGNASPRASMIPEKSIAVLPFENLSRDPDNAFFTDGVQDEILMHLAKIAELKVISRTSVMQYKSGVARNLREISQQLGVAHVVEGSVQRAANRVRVNAQLIDARTDAHLWAQTYDRDLADVFAIQSEIAKAIADQLQAKLSPAEKTAIEKPLTADLAAFDLYTRAKTLLLTTAFSITRAQNLEQAVELLNRAVARDPAFFDAYLQLTYAHGQLYSLGLDHTASRLASAEATLQVAIQLRPDAGQTYLARAQYLYYCRRDYANALAELENARRSLPNDPRILELTGYILRRRGQQEEALRNLEKAIELDPRNSFIMQQIALSYQYLGCYREEVAILDRVLTITPKDVATKVHRALVELYWKADTKALHQAIESILAEDPGATSEVADGWFICALAERDHVAAERALVGLVDNRWLADAAVILSRSFGEGLLARVMKDEAKARAAFSKARAEQEKIVQAQPDYGPALCVLGLIDAGLGRKEAALEEARRAVELLPVEKDSVNGSRMLVYFAIVAGWAGEKDLALQQLELGLRAPNPSSALLNYGALKLLPFWDPLRGDPRFEKIVASLAPEPVAKSVPQKSIAVLPFENLSEEKANAFFADGVQDEILSNLARVADLKVISRTSANLYRTGNPRNAPEIGQQLGVAHLVEGSVQRLGDRLRIHAQLIDARTDTHLWAQTYDREAANLFAIQSEIAQSIAAQLQAKISSAERAEIAEPPTTDLTAHALYVQARKLGLEASHQQSLLKAVRLLEQAVARDPQFVLAYCLLGQVHLNLFNAGYDHTPARRDLAKVAIQNAVRLKPEAGEVHLALARYAYYGFLDYDSARAELDLARRNLPNDVDVYFLSGLLDRRQGRWTEAVRNFVQAVGLDPGNLSLLGNTAGTYEWLRRYSDSSRFYEHAIALTPRDHLFRLLRATQPFFERADLHPLREKLSVLLGDQPEAAANFAEISFRCAIAERDSTAVNRALASIPADGINGPNVTYPREWFAGVAARTFSDTAAARSSFTAARAIAERLVRDQPDYAPIWSLLGQIDAALGRKEEAIREGRRACELLPLSKDATVGATLITNLAMIYAWTGEKDLALEQLALSAQIPAGVTYGGVKLDPQWDSLRGDLRFEKIVACLAPSQSNK